MQNPGTRTKLSFSFSLAFYILTAAISITWFMVLLQIQLHLYHTMFFTSDLAQWCNMLYNTGWGKFLYSDFEYLSDGFNTYLNHHFSPSLGLLAPIYWLLPSPVTLIVIQVFAIATAGWLLAQIGKIVIYYNAHLPKWTLIVPLLAQGLYLFNQSTVEATICIPYGFSHDCFNPPLLFTTVFFYLKFKFSKPDDKRKRLSYLIFTGVCFFILLGVKENIPLVFTVFLVPVLLFDRRADKKLMLWALAGCGIMIMGSVAFQYMAKTNQGNVEVISDFLSLDTWASKFDSLYYISKYKILLCFIPLILTPQAYMPFFAEFSLLLVFDVPPFDWHAMPIVAIGGLAGMVGVIRLLLWMNAWRLWNKVLAALAIAAYMILLYIPTVWGGFNDLTVAREQVFSRSAPIPVNNIKEMARLIPLEAKLSATSDLVVFFVNRPHLRGPDQLKGIDMIITSDIASYRSDIELRECVRQLEKNGALLQIKQIGVLRLYRRNPSGPEIVYDDPERRKKKVADLKKVIRTNPDNAKAYYDLGLAYFELKGNRMAAKAFKQALHIKPDYFEACYAMGLSYKALGRHNEAMEAYKQAIHIKPDYAEPYCDLGIIYGRCGRFNEAIKFLTQAIRLKPDYAEAHYNLGLIYGQLGRYNEALKAYKQAVHSKPDYFEAHCNMGAVYSQLGRYDEAVETLKQAINITPHYIPYYNLGVVYYGLGHYDKAIAAYKQAIDFGPNNVGAHFNLGIAYLEIGDKTSALNEYKILKDLDKKQAEQLLNYIHKPDKSKKM